MKQYILVNKIPVPCDIGDMDSWDIKNRRVAETEIDGVRVSTVFLCIDHGYENGKPVLFETMIFGGYLNDEQDRYCTWNEAVIGHETMVERVKNALQKELV